MRFPTPVLAESAILLTPFNTTVFERRGAYGTVKQRRIVTGNEGTQGLIVYAHVFGQLPGDGELKMLRQGCVGIAQQIECRARPGTDGCRPLRFTGCRPGTVVDQRNQTKQRTAFQAFHNHRLSLTCVRLYLYRCPELRY